MDAGGALIRFQPGCWMECPSDTDNVLLTRSVPAGTEVTRGESKFGVKRKTMS